GADRVVRILASRGGLRQEALDQDVAEVDRLDVVAGQVDVEVEHRHRQVGPEHDVGEHRRRRGVVDREQGGDATVRQIATRPGTTWQSDLEVREQRRGSRYVVDRADDGTRLADQGQQAQ